MTTDLIARHRRGRRAGVALLLLLGAACSSNRVAYGYHIDGPLNPNIGGGIENMLQLKSFLLPEEAASLFRAASWDELAAAETGGNYGVVSSVQIVEPPRSDAQRTGELVAGEKNERSTWLGVIANFNQKSGDDWKALVPLADVGGLVLWLQDHRVLFAPPQQPPAKAPAPAEAASRTGTPGS